MSQYFCTPNYLPATAENHTLLALIQAAGLPATDVQTSDAYPGQVIVICSTGLDAGQQTQLNTVVAAWDARPRAARSLLAIYTDLVALTNTQKTNIWADLSSGTPAKYLQDTGTNTAALVVLDWVVQSSGATGAALTSAKLRAAAMYVQDNVDYLVHPTFDSTINVPGDQLA